MHASSARAGASHAPQQVGSSMKDLVRRLVLAELGVSRQELEEDEEEGVLADVVDESFFRTFQSLSSSLGRRAYLPGMEDDGVSDTILQHLMRRPPGPASRGSVEPHLRFQSLCQRMRRQPVLRRPEFRCAVLRVLLLLRDCSDGDDLGRTGSAIAELPRHLTAFDSPADTFMRAPRSKTEGDDGASEAKLRSDDDGATLAPSMGWQIPGVAGTPPADLSEEHLLRDLLHALQGVSSTCFKYRTRESKFELDAAVVLRKPVWCLAQQILELGGLHMRLCQAVNSAVEAEGESLLHQALCEAVREQLREYYKTLAVLAAKMDTPPGRKASQGGTSELSLRKLWTWLQVPRERVRLLASLCDACKPLNGGALASAVYGCSRVGGATRDICAAILQRVIEPLVSMIRAWMTEGDLRDPFGEFFVCVDTSVSLDELWTRMYSLDIEMVPCFITLELARKILLTGKSVNFIRLCCPGQEWLQPKEVTADGKTGNASSASLAMPGDPRSSQDMGGDGPGTSLFDERVPLHDLTLRVEQAGLRTNRRLVHLMMKQYNLGDHCLGLRRFLLLGQGDFVESLMDLAKEELDKVADTCYQHQFAGALDMAIRQSNTQFCPPEVLQRLGVKLLTASSGERGWDVFVLDYAIDSPLHVVFQPEAMRQYDRAFTFLWKLRRVSHSLAACWRQHMALQRHLVWRGRGAIGVSAASPELGLEMGQTLHRCTLLRNEMHHFVQNIHSYIMCEVIETSWSKLQTGWQSCSDLDQVILEHQRYLTCIQEGAFLAPSTEAILTALASLFALALEFAELHDTVCTSSFEATEAIRSEPRGPAPFARSLAECRAQLDHIGAQFLVRLQGLLRTLEGQALGGQLSADLRFLVCRLDFNGYYEQRRAALAGEPALR